MDLILSLLNFIILIYTKLPLLPSTTVVVERYCFYTCLSVILFTGECLGRPPSLPWADTPGSPPSGRHPPPQDGHCSRNAFLLFDGNNQRGWSRILSVELTDALFL